GWRHSPQGVSPDIQASAARWYETLEKTPTNPTSRKSYPSDRQARPIRLRSLSLVHWDRGGFVHENSSHSHGLASRRPYKENSCSGSGRFPSRAWNRVRHRRFCPSCIDLSARQISLRIPPITSCAVLCWLPLEHPLNLSDWLRLLLRPQPASYGAHIGPRIHPKSSSALQARQRLGISR